jgi:CheY-like chemotaxis protein
MTKILASPAPNPTDQPSAPVVLVVEDDPQFSELLALYLRQERYTPVQHYSGVGVVALARELQPTLITLDIMLPGRDGWDVLRDLKADPQTRDIPVLIVSVLEESELALSLGAVNCLGKPLDQADLHALLARLATVESAEARAKILIVDDNPEMLLLLEAMLPARRYALLTAATGTEALALARSEHPDAILLDLMLPGISGFEVLETLRSDPTTADIPVIILTAKDVTAQERQLLDSHSQGVMSKTHLTPQALAAELNRLA